MLAGGFNEAKAGPTVGASAMPTKAQAASPMNIAIGWSLARWRSASFGRRSARSGAWRRCSPLMILTFACIAIPFAAFLFGDETNLLALCNSTNVVQI
jgi:hypothetical protein